MLSSESHLQTAIDQLASPSSEERRAACDQLYRRWHGNLAAYVLHCYPGLTSDRVVNAVNDAFLQLAESAQSQDYDPKHPERLLFTVAKRRACDELRAQTRRIKHQENLATIVQAAGGGLDKHTAADGAENAELLQLIRTSIAAMPERQRHVAQLMVEHCDGPVTARRIQELARETDGVYLTLPAANRALEEVKKKLRAVLVRFGLSPE